ncbi:MAG: hypothetical protein ABIC04_07590 [Nanoarchaeota archaeon]
MSEKKIYLYSGLIGFILGSILFFWIVRDWFIKNITDPGFWTLYFVWMLEPTIVGILIAVSYKKLMKLKWNKMIIWALFLLITILLLRFTKMWFSSLSLRIGLVGL